MTCNHCVESVRCAVAECTGVQTVQVSLKRGRVVVEGNNLDSDRIISAIEELGYRARILNS
ncbi:heavy-metal-associated domain-containing protein [Candidatus Bipolaricaulota bacterium]|nr:heavy-metal-associated domain-containing protein [Candidatus Bipolaricaulota bacterium]